MKIPKIKAKQALEDIRAGMDDISLMKKYKLSAKGLQSLFKKLGQAGIIKHVNAREVLADLRAGMSSDELTKKYSLTRRGMQNLFWELDRAGVLKASAEQDGVPAKVVINIHEIAKDIKSGMNRTQLMDKYRMSPRALRWVSATLISSGAMSWKEILDKLSIAHEDLVPDKPRGAKRYPVLFGCNIYEADNGGVPGKIRDISHKGIGVLGIKAKVGDTKTLVVPGDEFGEFAAFNFDAECRWTKRDPAGEFLAGFEISYISIGNLKEFQLLLHWVRFGNRDKKFL
ncbi:MAG: PilZ domain-containing protein [Desulfomonilaceae bacterium]